MQHQSPREYCYIISFAAHTQVVSYSGTYVPPPGMTRHEVFLKIREDHLHMLSSRMQSVANVCFFSMEPNQLA